MSLAPVLHQDWIDAIASFVANDVEFIIVEAFAMAFHELPRTTGDIDFFVGYDRDNAQRVAKAIEEFGSGHIQVDPEDFSKPNHFAVIGRSPIRVDVLTSISGVTFEEAWRDRQLGHLGGHQVAFPSREHLLRNKLASGRSKDKVDAERLTKRLRRRPR
ncbi:MAG: hypothetical protein ACHQ50_10920 [Fimbriimonadales bacterium]